MPAERTPDELRAAVDSMFRIRAVESPPSDQGLRTVWHRGARNAELVSEIDTQGRVARHEFSLFDEVVVWERGRGFVTGQTLAEGSTRGAAKVGFDHAVNTTRISRVLVALQKYEGPDRIIGHLRELVVALDAEANPVEDLGQVTGNTQIPQELLVAAQQTPRDRSLWLIIGGFVLVTIGLVWLLVS